MHVIQVEIPDAQYPQSEPSPAHTLRSPLNAHLGARYAAFRLSRGGPGTPRRSPWDWESLLHRVV